MGALRINYNYQSDFTLNNLRKTEYNLNKSLERLASGYRINRAADDAAGLYIADQLKTYAVSLNQGTRNAQDGVSIAQIAQGSLTEVYNILNDIKSKTIQASNTLDSNARAQLQQDINHLVDAIDKIFSDTEFNGLKIFGSGVVNAANGSVSGVGKASFVIHYGGRTNQELTLAIGFAGAAAGSTGTAASAVAIGTGTGYVIDVTAQSKANASVQTVDNLIKALDNLNAQVGSYQIELEKIISNNQTQRINTQEAESRIRNVDMAEEMSNFTKYQILMQSGTAMLAQSNQVPQMVLQLLR
ncbi:flagellin [Hydrogenothermus marinus]|uniref:Flagellin n=1 Tax=Hydrogenothermus marinus TaxID=133270 RepID=A0A3M0B9U6_9AQUI|nr:flagellin [Hydrogenothermus marinus]RMA93254.1 flagellin [Hydrogenothermus marinus]